MRLVAGRVTFGVVAAAILAGAIAVPAHQSGVAGKPDAPPATDIARGGPVALAAVRVRTADDLARLRGFDVTEGRRGDEIDVVLWPGDADRLRELGLSFRLRATDLAAADVAAGYRHLSDYGRDMAALAARHPDRVRPITLPRPSLEGRPITGVEIASGVHQSDGRPVALFVGLHHAREWPSGEVVADLAIELADSYGTDPVITELLDEVRVIVIPVMNPDGFSHSRESLVDVQSYAQGQAGQGSYWRKNRRGPELPTERRPLAWGVDLNRNYAWSWGYGYLSLASPASSYPTDPTYQGDAPFSEPETENVRGLVLGRHVTTLVSTHTYGERVMWPWGSQRELAPDHELFRSIGTAMAATNGYQAHRSIELYPASGVAEDWAYAATGTLAFTFELGRDFHAPYAATVPALYQRNREALLMAIEAARQPGLHSVLTGTIAGPGGVPVRATLRLTRSGQTPIDPRTLGEHPVVVDAVDTSRTASGAFTWHVNPSTRPIAPAPEAYRLTASAPGFQTLVIDDVQVGRGETFDLGTLTLSPA